MVSNDVTMRFDIEAVKRQSLENPVYYVQYGHARIASILRKAAERGIQTRPIEETNLDRLEHEAELDLLRAVAAVPSQIATAAEIRAPHRLTHAAQDLAARFHHFYAECPVLSDDTELTQAGCGSAAAPSGRSRTCSACSACRRPRRWSEAMRREVRAGRGDILRRAKIEGRRSGMSERVLRVGVLGCGTVGAAVVRLLDRHRDDIERRAGCRLHKVAVRDPAKPRHVGLTPRRSSTTRWPSSTTPRSTSSAS